MSKYLTLFLLVCCCCKTTQHTIAERNSIAPAATPMTCKIKGEIVSLIYPQGEDKGTLCAKYACSARVKIKEVVSCGPSVSVLLNAGDIVEIKFAYTLHNTAELFPAMKVHYPGLNAGDFFTADAEQHSKIGHGSYVIYGYDIVQN